MKEISNNSLEKYGISVKCHIMDNNEKRFRMIGSDGSSYIRTEATETGGWQNSHYHTKLQEIYIVQSGQILFAEYCEENLTVSKYMEGEFCISHPMIPHNIFTYPGTILHTVKFGDCSNPDWLEFKELDLKLKENENGMR